MSFWQYLYANPRYIIIVCIALAICILASGFKWFYLSHQKKHDKNFLDSSHKEDEQTSLSAGNESSADNNTDNDVDNNEDKINDNGNLNE